MNRLHITGCPRSGTTLMMELVSTCFEGNKAPKAEVDVFAPVPGNPEVYFSKQPSDIKRMLPLLDTDPNLSCICMVRDPRSVITSRNRGAPDKYFCNFRVWNSCYAAAAKLRGNSRYLMIRYEELTEDPNRIQSIIQKAFPWLVKKHDFSDYQEIAKDSATSQSALGTVRKVSSDRVRLWEKHLQRVKYEYERHPEMADILIDLGYEPDRAWLTALSTITADKGGCRYPDNVNPIKELEYRIRTAIKIRHYIKNLL